MLTQTSAIEEAEFARLMTRLGPFEAHPVIAVAVSGGADSMAVCLLADAWARARGGWVHALTVDHRLRKESLDEAEQVGRWLNERGIAHSILGWTGDKPKTGVQAAARDARYALLGDWCEKTGVLHLLLGHHLEDQAETILLRLARGSGVDGLAGMSAISETPQVRLLRPLLDSPKARLKETLQALGQPWIEDPSNRNQAFARVRMRDFLAAEALTPQRLVTTAKAMGRARAVLEQAAARLLVRSASLGFGGYAILDPVLLFAAEEELQLRALSALCRALGGNTYPPRLERLERLRCELAAGLKTRRTFCGCVLMPSKDRILVMREMRAVSGPVEIVAGQTIRWDGRFLLRSDLPGQVAALGVDGWRSIREFVSPTGIPAAVCPSLPAFRVEGRIAAVPHLNYREPGQDGGRFSALFVPERALAQVGHCLV